jgi:hypothetical protein
MMLSAGLYWIVALPVTSVALARPAHAVVRQAQTTDEGQLLGQV